MLFTVQTFFATFARARLGADGVVTFGVLSQRTRKSMPIVFGSGRKRDWAGFCTPRPGFWRAFAHRHLRSGDRLASQAQDFSDLFRAALRPVPEWTGVGRKCREWVLSCS